MRALGIADGWGVRACAAALTVGLIFWFLFPWMEKERKTNCTYRRLVFFQFTIDRLTYRIQI